MRWSSQSVRLTCGLLLVALVVIARLVPHPMNFGPVAAVALFSGFLFRNYLVAAAIPLAGLLMSDTLLGFYSPGVVVAVYCAQLFPILLRSFVRANSPLRIAGCAVASSVLFYISTNAAVWFFTPMYDRTLQGLAGCYVKALPYFRNTVAGDLIWAAVLFGSFALASLATRRSGAIRVFMLRLVGRKAKVLA